MSNNISNIHNKYSDATLSKFDIIGSYFVHLYYNEFYSKAKNLKIQNNASNLTDAYKNILSSYVDFSTQQDFFKQIVKGIHTYCISTTRYTTMTHKECIDFMISEFVPSKLWSSLREQQKNKLFHESLINCIKTFTEKIISNHLHIIIDNRDHNENVAILQDLFLSIILLEKDIIFSKFINPQKNSTVELFRSKLQNLLNENKKIIKDNTILKNKIKIYENLNNKNSLIIKELQFQNKQLLNNINIINNKLKYSKSINNNNNNLMIKNKFKLKPDIDNESIKSNSNNSNSNNSIKSDLIKLTDTKDDDINSNNEFDIKSDTESNNFNLIDNELDNIIDSNSLIKDLEFDENLNNDYDN